MTTKKEKTAEKEMENKMCERRPLFAFALATFYVFLLARSTVAWYANSGRERRRVLRALKF
jgi:hypothetical protein